MVSNMVKGCYFLALHQCHIFINFLGQPNLIRKVNDVSLVRNKRGGKMP